MLSTQQYKMLALTAIGGTLEFYDFTIYALFAPYISRHFFPDSDQIVLLINTFAVFAVGYLVRPFGAAIFGHIGDRYGRKRAFTLAIFLMAFTTLFIGCLPSYQTIGITATVLLILLRILQGFSVSGEVSGAVIFTMEHAPIQYRGLTVGIILMFITLGNTLGAGIGLFITSMLSPDQMLSWGWRIPFVLGFILGLVSFILRMKTVETPVFIAYANNNKLHRLPIVTLLQSAFKQIIAGTFLTATPAAMVSFFLYLPTFLTHSIHITVSSAYLLNCFSFCVFAVMTAVIGGLSDTLGKQPFMITGTLLLIVCGYFLFSALTIYNNAFIWLFILCMGSFAAMVNGCYMVSIAESFSPALRYSGLAMSHSVSLAIFGGLAPVGFTYFMKLGAGVYAPYCFLLACFILSMISLLAYTGNKFFAVRDPSGNHIQIEHSH